MGKTGKKLKKRQPTHTTDLLQEVTGDQVEPPTLVSVLDSLPESPEGQLIASELSPNVSAFAYTLDPDEPAPHPTTTQTASPEYVESEPLSEYEVLRRVREAADALDAAENEAIDRLGPLHKPILYERYAREQAHERQLGAEMLAIAEELRQAPGGDPTARYRHFDRIHVQQLEALSRVHELRERLRRSLAYQMNQDSAVQAAQGALNLAGNPRAPTSLVLGNQVNGVTYYYTIAYQTTRDPAMREPCLNLISSVFNRPFSETDLARLSTARPGAEIEITPYGSSSFQLTMDAEGDRHLDFRVSRLSDGRVEISHIGVINLGTRSTASAADIVNTLLEWKAVGINTISAQALRSPTANGYLAWARLGFVGDIPEYWTDHNNVRISVLGPAQARFGSDVTRVEQLVQQPDGFNWWREHGGTWYASFPLDENSYSMQTLRHFQRRRENQDLLP